MGGGRGQAQELGGKKQAGCGRGGQGVAEDRQRNLGVKNRQGGTEEGRVGQRAGRGTWE